MFTICLYITNMCSSLLCMFSVLPVVLKDKNTACSFWINILCLNDA